MRRLDDGGFASKRSLARLTIIDLVEVRNCRCAIVKRSHFSVDILSEPKVAQLHQRIQAS